MSHHSNLTYKDIADRLRTLEFLIRSYGNDKYLLNTCGHTRCTDENVCFETGARKGKLRDYSLEYSSLKEFVRSESCTEKIKNCELQERERELREREQRKR